MTTFQPRPVTNRSLRLFEHEGHRVLTIVMPLSPRRAEEKFYHLTSLPAESGCAFELRQSELCGGQVYVVRLDDFGSCTCLGYRGWRPCKHLAALRKLRELGRI
jgi:hypothetical protein